MISNPVQAPGIYNKIDSHDQPPKPKMFWVTVWYFELWAFDIA